MKFFWDTSAAINAALSPTVKARLNADEHVARVHLLAEFFSTMTGRGIVQPDATGAMIKIKLDADEAAKWLREFTQKVTLLELSGEDMLDGLDQARARGVQGARVHDYSHALAATKSTADVVLTRNTDHFIGLTGSIPVEWP